MIKQTANLIFFADIAYLTPRSKIYFFQKKNSTEMFLWKIVVQELFDFFFRGAGMRFVQEGEDRPKYRNLTSRFLHAKQRGWKHYWSNIW